MQARRRTDESPCRKILQTAGMLGCLALGATGSGCLAEPLDKGPDLDPAVADGAADSFSEVASPKGRLELGTPVVARFDASSHHLYELELPAAASVEIALGGADGEPLDTVLRVYGPRDGSGQLPDRKVAYDDDGGEGTASLLAGLELAPGAYAVVASTYGGRPARGRAYRLLARCAGGGCGDPAPGTDCEPAGRTGWTVLLYGAYDAGDIPSVRFALERRLASWAPAEGVRVVMLEDLTGADNTNVYELTGAGARLVRAPGELNTGEPSTLEDFVAWGARCFPAERYALYAIGHSVSVLDGGLVDYSHGRTYMPWTGFRQALERAGVHLAVINLGTCMTSTLELAYELRGLGDYLVSYQSFGQGYTAAGWIDALANDPAIDPGTLARRFARAQASEGMEYLPQSVGVIDLAGMDRIREALEGLAPLLSTALGQDADPFQEARRATQPGPTSASYSGMIDLIDWIDQVLARVDEPALEEALRGLRAAADQAIAASYVKFDPAGENPHDRNHGLSVAFPTPENPIGRFASAGGLLQAAPGDLLLYADTRLDELVLQHFE